jgi:hypothetical protein
MILILYTTLVCAIIGYLTFGELGAAVGAFLGALVGLFAYALCAVSAQADDYRLRR